MNTQVKYLKTCKKIECRLEGFFIIIEKFSVHGENKNAWIKVNKKDIDSVIVRERAKIQVYNNYEPKGLSESIQEIEYIDKIKEITI